MSPAISKARADESIWMDGHDEINNERSGLAPRVLLKCFEFVIVISHNAKIAHCGETSCHVAVGSRVLEIHAGIFRALVYIQRRRSEHRGKYAWTQDEQNKPNVNLNRV